MNFFTTEPYKAKAAPSHNLGEEVMKGVARMVELSDQAEAVAGLIVNVASLAGRVPPPREFVVDGLIPCRTVTLLGGDGGTGKSLLALQLATAAALGRQWLARNVAPGAVLYVSAEDELDEVHRRLRTIAAAEGFEVADLGRLWIWPLAGEDALLAMPDRAGVLHWTPLWEAICRGAQEHQPGLIVLDTNADFFGGNEIERRQVRQFVSRLRGLAMTSDCAILMLSHPSVSGMQNGSGTSGSTAWNNSVRSRLYLDRITGDGARELDPDLRKLSVMKANYARAGDEIRMKWTDGRFVAETAPVGLPKLAASARAERVFLDLLAKFEREGRRVSPHRSSTFAPAVFAKEPDSEGVRKFEFEQAMSVLFSQGKIRVERVGSPSRKTEKLALTDAENVE